MRWPSAEAERNWLEAAEAALAKNDSTFAVLPMNLMTNQWVYLAKLKKKGYVVESHFSGAALHNGKRRPRAGVR